VDTPLTIPEILARSAGISPDKPFSRWANREGESYTLGEIEADSRLLALALLESGVVREERVGVCSENRPRWGAAYLAIQRAGAIAVPIDALLKEREVGEIGRAAELRYIFASSRLEPVVRAAMPRARILSLDDSDTAYLSWPRLLERGRASTRRAQMEERQAQPDRLAVLIFTSGTTGRPKAVALTHRNIACNVNSVLEGGFSISPSDRMLSVLPLHHTFECTMGFLLPLAAQAEVVYARSLKSKELMEDLRESRATILLGVPLLYSKMIQGLERALKEGNPLARGIFLPIFRALRSARAPVSAGRVLLAPLRSKAGMGPVRFFVSGAAALPADVFHGFRALGVEMIQGYGLTETSPVLTVNPPGAAREGSVGPPIPGVEIFIDQPGPDGVGEVLARGENVMQGYYGDPHTTARVMAGDFFRTGDLGRLDADGYLYICGRSKSMIATGSGKKIYPEEVEAALLASPYIVESLVYGKRDPRTSHEDVCAILYPDWARLEAQLNVPAGTVAEDQAKAFLKTEVARVCQQLADFKRVRDFSLRREDFPRTTTAKIKRFLFVGGQERPEAESPGRS
jgi:long-chain acyl-CoA synthetase